MAGNINILLMELHGLDFDLRKQMFKNLTFTKAALILKLLPKMYDWQSNICTHYLKQEAFRINII